MRTRAEIDQEYSHTAKVYGDRMYKASRLQEEIRALHDQLTKLSMENAVEEQPRALQSAPMAALQNEPNEPAG